MEVYKLEESEEEVTVLSPDESGKQQKGQLQEWELLRVLNLKEESALNGPIWSRCIIALTYTARSHFQHTLNRERWDQG